MYNHPLYSVLYLILHFTVFRIKIPYSCKEAFMKRLFPWAVPAFVLFLIVLFFTFRASPVFPPAAERSEEQEEQASTEVVILTTTDIHGKCWDGNLLTGHEEKNNLLRISTAVRQIRQKYGPENVLLIDNGDLFQGTQVSQVQLQQRSAGTSNDPPAMAVCLKEIGYDAFVPGNHEFNFEWDNMRGVYQWLDENGVPVLAANICHDGSDPACARGDNAFTPYIIKTISVNGHDHKIGILGFENTDITRWDQPANYPGLMFRHPENDTWSMAWEAGLYLPQMKDEGCEFIIVSYHSGMGEAGSGLRFGINTEDQGARMIRESEGIDFVILGHDHTSSYSNTSRTDRAGKQIPVVNGGGTDLTKSVFRFSEDPEGRLVWELTDSENLNPGDYEADQALKEKIRPYAAAAEAEIEKPIGTTGDGWDQSYEFLTRQTDTVDLVSKAIMEIPTRRLREKYGESGTAALKSVAGLDHLDVDMSVNSFVNSGYTVSPGDFTMRDIYRLYTYSNTIYVLPIYGRDIRSVLEENAEDHLKARRINGQVYIYEKGSNFTNLVFGGLNFTYDLSKPKGSRVRIEGFSNGRPFEEDTLYLASVNNYILGNSSCGMRSFSEKDAIWSQADDENGGTIHDMIAEYVRERCAAQGELTPDSFNWHWSVICPEDPDAPSSSDLEAAATLADQPEDGHTYVLYHEASGTALTDKVKGTGLKGAEIEAYENILLAPLPENTLVFTARVNDDGTFLLSDAQGRYLSAIYGGVKLTKSPSKNDLSLWKSVPGRGGMNLINMGLKDNKALQYYSQSYITFSVSRSSPFIFNFYETEGE